jgi:hypothetical protein
MVTIKKNRKITNVGETGTLVHYLWNCKMA